MDSFFNDCSSTTEESDISKAPLGILSSVHLMFSNLCLLQQRQEDTHQSSVGAANRYTPLLSKLHQGSRGVLLCEKNRS
jgi:hypothetical protein